MQPISAIGKKFGLSRSTLLYYDRIGLLSAPARSAAGYRRYGVEAFRRLERLRLYRSAGLPLRDIRRILDEPGAQGGVAAILERRLASLHEEQARIRDQQDVLLRLLSRPELVRRYRGLDRQGWVALLRATGLAAQDMWRWHAEFERAAPEAHADFLAGLRIPRAEVESIRRTARGRLRRRPRQSSSSGSSGAARTSASRSSGSQPYSE